MNKLIGRVLATEKSPTTMDKFCFWTTTDRKLNAFDIVKVRHNVGDTKSFTVTRRTKVAINCQIATE